MTWLIKELKLLLGGRFQTAWCRPSTVGYVILAKKLCEDLMKFPFPLEIALIDDEPDIVEMTNMAVSRFEEFTPLCFNDAGEALKVIEERKIRVIFTDLLMPGIDGQDIIDQCKNFSWNTDIIVMTGIANIERAFKCFDSGAWEVLLKPVDLSRISAALNRVVDRYKLWHETCDKLGME